MINCVVTDVTPFCYRCYTYKSLKLKCLKYIISWCFYPENIYLGLYLLLISSSKIYLQEKRKLKYILILFTATV